MTSNIKVALAGATGNLGRPILDNLLAAGHLVIVLTRTGSDSTSKLPSNPNLTIKEVDYSSVSSLQPALEGVTAVVSTLASMAVSNQNALVDAAVAAGVKRYLPSEFGSNLANPNTRALPVYGGKAGIQDYLKGKAAENPDFTYTLVYNAIFFDWGIENGFFINIKEHTATLHDGGSRPVSTTRLDTIGKAVVGVLAHLEETKNRAVYVQDAAVSQLELIDIVKGIDGKEWKTTTVETAKSREEAYEELKKGKDANMGKAMMGFLTSAIWADGYGNDFGDNLDNELLGIPQMSKKEIEEMIKGIVEKVGGI